MAALPHEYGLCVSEAARPVAISGYKLPPQSVEVLYPGLDTQPFNKLHEPDRLRIRREFGAADSDPLIVMAARFDPVKGHRAMIRMFSQVAAELPRCLLVFAGDGPEQCACKDYVTQLGLAQRVRFAGNRGDIPAVMFAADLIVVPSEQEGLGLTAVEANLSGKPVVAYRTGGLPEVIQHPVCGTLVDAADENGFVKAVVRHLRMQGSTADAVRRKAIASQRFALARHVQRLSELHCANRASYQRERRACRGA